MKKIPSILFIAIFLLVGHRASEQDFGDIGNNFWGGGLPTSTDYTFTNIAGDWPTAETASGFECSSGLDMVKGKGLKPLGIQMHILNNDTMSHCDSLFDIGYGDEQEALWQQSYDTLKLFMEQCPFYVGTNYNDGVAAVEGFRYIDADATQLGKLNYPNFLAWLKSVLYLNPDTAWYCSDVSDMLTAFQNDSNNAGAVALQYIVTSGKCPVFDSEYYDDLGVFHTRWLDSIYKKYGYPPFGNIPTAADSINVDTLAHPYQSPTFPSLQQVGLQILLGPQYAGVQQNAPTAVGTQALLSAQLIENPVNNEEIDISYDMGRTALVTMELRDVLGRSVPIANAKYQLEQPGDHNATLPAPNLPPGTYYLRITTDVGDAITLKIVKE